MNKWLFIRTHVLGATQHQLAEALGVSQSTVAWWDKGRSDPKAENIEKIRIVARLDNKVLHERWLTEGPTDEEVAAMQPEDFVAQRGGFRIPKKKR